MLYPLTRNLLFRLDAEAAHELSIAAFRNAPQLSTLPYASGLVSDPVELLGLKYENRVGLAAGLDKNGECLEAWSRLGFGFVEVGTVTPRPQPGNPRPRMFRLPEHKALINRLGFNNKGVDYLVERIRESDFQRVLGVNIGKNADTPVEHALDDYLICLRKVYQAASYVTVNISSPNTRNLRDLQSGELLDGLLSGISRERSALEQQTGKRTPVFVKIAPDVDDAGLQAIATAVHEHAMDGLIATNTTIARSEVSGHPHADEQGGLSGKPLLESSSDVLRRLRERLGADFLLIGVGGICSAQDALGKRRAGADLIQLYSGFIYQGPGLISECARALSVGRYDAS